MSKSQKWTVDDTLFWLAIACIYLGSMLGTGLWLLDYYSVSFDEVIEIVRKVTFWLFLIFNGIGLMVVPTIFWDVYTEVRDERRKEKRRKNNEQLN